MESIASGIDSAYDNGNVYISANLAGVPFGQFPVVAGPAGDPVVIFSTRRNGIWALTMP